MHIIEQSCGELRCSAVVTKVAIDESQTSTAGQWEEALANAGVCHPLNPFFGKDRRSISINFWRAPALQSPDFTLKIDVGTW
jgi:hypothetical protein